MWKYYQTNPPSVSLSVCGGAGRFTRCQTEEAPGMNWKASDVM